MPTKFYRETALSKTMRTFLCLVLCAISLGGCASGPSPAAKPQPSHNAKGESRVTVMWQCPRRIIQTAGVYVDGERRALLKPNQFAELTLPSGLRELKVKFVGPLGMGMPSTIETFDFKPGEMHFIVFSYQFDITAVVPIGPVASIQGNTTKSLIEVPARDAAFRLSPMIPGKVE